FSPLSGYDRLVSEPSEISRSVGRPAAESLRGGTGVRVVRGGKGRRPKEALSPGYVVDSDPEKDEKDLKEDPADRGNNDDDESSNNDDDDDDDVEKDEEDKKEEEHLAPADPFDVSTDDLVPSS
nr:hypothetical protein [Tanacetum cinerariifolium]